mmetsp:Transcript_26530/g.57688  ORF Transcript_26530/g.57688 Transcript_26530/m.57688 type:complete len:330 (-) Transcript_26530:871-1860(-)
MRRALQGLYVLRVRKARDDGADAALDALPADGAPVHSLCAHDAHAGVLAWLEQRKLAVFVVEGLVAHVALSHAFQCPSRAPQPRAALPHRRLLLLLHTIDGEGRELLLHLDTRLRPGNVPGQRGFVAAKATGLLPQLSQLLPQLRRLRLLLTDMRRPQQLSRDPAVVALLHPMEQPLILDTSRLRNLRHLFVVSRKSRVPCLRRILRIKFCKASKLGSPIERGLASLVDRANRRPHIEQFVHSVRPASSRGIHQRGCSKCIYSVHHRAGLHHRAHQLKVAVTGNFHQRRDAVASRYVCDRPVIQMELDHIRERVPTLSVVGAQSSYRRP